MTKRPRPHLLPIAAGLALGACLLAGCGGSDAGAATGSADAVTRGRIEAELRAAMAEDHLRAVIVRITVDGDNVYTAAMGESADGERATPDMHFRNGSFAFTYIGHIFALLADADGTGGTARLSLDDRLDRWFPDLPRASEISLRNLLNMTSGYADYVYQPPIFDAVMNEPHKQWSDDELLAIGFAAPPMFEPGSNWGYSHTNYVVLGKVLERITQRPLAQVMQDYIIGPMQLGATGDNGGSSAIPEPVLRSFSPERGRYEESTFWNPSWTIGQGAVQTSNIHDVTRSMEIIGSGVQVSPGMHRQQLGANLVGFGHEDDSGSCKPCRPMTTELSYGLGVILTGPWITQTKSFAGAAATSGYLPSRKLTISVATTYLPAGFKADGTPAASSTAVFNRLAAVMAPADAPPAR